MVQALLGRGATVLAVDEEVGGAWGQGRSSGGDFLTWLVNKLDFLPKGTLQSRDPTCARVSEGSL